MIDLTFDRGKGVWRGSCPRCGMGSFFSVIRRQENFPNNDRVEIVECHGGHPFVIITDQRTDGNKVRFATPINGAHSIPEWLPEEYRMHYGEMMYDYYSGKYISAVAVAGIILDAHVNSFLNKNGDKRKSLGKRLELLASAGKIDSDQFADSTVARITRNGVVHPSNISEEVNQSGVEEVIQAVSSCLERYYKFRRAKALPAPEEQVGDPDTPDDSVESEEDAI